MLFGLFYSLEPFANPFFKSTFPKERLLFSFFSLFDLLSYFLLLGFWLPFLGSIDLWGDLLLDRFSLLLFFALLTLLPDFCNFWFGWVITFELPGLLDLLLASLWSSFLFYLTPLFISNKIIMLKFDFFTVRFNFWISFNIENAYKFLLKKGKSLALRKLLTGNT